MKNWFKSLKNLIVQQKLTFPCDLCCLTKNRQNHYFYAHENNKVFDKSMLLCTKDCLTTIQNKVNKQNVLEVSTQVSQNTKRRFKLITNVTIFARFLKKVPMGCPDSVIPEQLLRNHQFDCLISDAHMQ